MSLAWRGVDNWCRHIANMALLNSKENGSVLPTQRNLPKLNDQRWERWDSLIPKCLFSLNLISISICLLCLMVSAWQIGWLTFSKAAFPFTSPGKGPHVESTETPFLGVLLFRVHLTTKQERQVFQKHLLKLCLGCPNPAGDQPFLSHSQLEKCFCWDILVQ